MLTLSFQKINTYSRCGLQYYFRYVEGIIIPPSVEMVVGRAFHKSVESFYKKKKEICENPELDFLLSIYSDELDKGFEEELLLDEYEIEKGKNKIKGEYKDKGTRTLKLYYQEKAIHIAPQLIEIEFTIPLEDVVKYTFNGDFSSEDFKNVFLTGYVDLVSDKKVIDHKTRKTRPSSNEADKSQQLTIYTLGYKELTGELPEKVVLENIILPAGNDFGKIITLESKRTEEDINRLLRRILRIVDGIRKGVFIPPDQGSWACSYCGYRRVGICKEYLI